MERHTPQADWDFAPNFVVRSCLWAANESLSMKIHNIVTRGKCGLGVGRGGGGGEGGRGDIPPFPLPCMKPWSGNFVYIPTLLKYKRIYYKMCVKLCINFQFQLLQVLKPHLAQRWWTLQLQPSMLI